MKRMLAFLLCWTMLLSQLVMLAEAAKMQDQSDIFYLEENGIHVEDGAEVIMDQTPLGKSEPTDRYSPSVPKFMPAALKNLGLMPREEEVEDAPPAYDVGDDIEPEDYEVYEKYEIYQAKFNKSKIMIFQVAGEDAASEYIYDTMDMPVEITPTVSPLWYTMPSLASPKYGYNYIRAEDVTLVGHKRPAKVEYYLDEETGIAVHLPDLPATRELRVAPVEATRAPMREVPGRVMGERTLLASFKVGVHSRDGATWSGEQETRVCFTLPEMPEIEQKGSYYAEVVDDQGNVEEITVYPYCWVNTLFLDMPLDREVFVYSVDYPDEDKTIFDMGEGLEMYLSERYDRMNADRPFKDVIDFSFSNPDVMDITPIYNDKGEVIDWMFIVTKPFHTLETFTLTFKEDVKGTRATTHSSTGVWGTSINISGDHYIAANGTVDLKGNCTVTGTALIRVGGGATSYKVSHLRIAKRITITGTLSITIDSGCGGSSVYRWNNSDVYDLYAPMLYVKDSGKLICIGGHDSAYAPTTNCRVKLSGNKMSVARALVYTSSDSVVRFYNTIICDAYNTRDDADSSVDRLGGGLYMNNAGDNAYIDICDYVTFENCKAVEGGGIYIANGRINVTKSIEGKTSAQARGYFKSCNASGHGGAIYIKGGTKGRIDPNDDTFLYVGVDGSGNTANYGAGIYVANGTFNGTGTIATRYNTATNHGGGLMVEGGTLTISGSQIVWVGYNKATNGYGGGVNVIGSGTALKDTTSGTFSVYGNTAGTYGGGVCLSNSATFNTNGMSIGNDGDAGRNTAGDRGGGIYISNGTFTSTGSITIKNNKAAWGGGICITGGSYVFKATMAIHSNTATSKGGGVYVYNGTITCETSDQMNIYSNTANYGGGMYIGGSTDSATDTTKKNITFNGSGTGGIDVYSNTGNTNGGGIMAENCTWSMGTPLYSRDNTTPGNGGGININGWVNSVTMTATKKLSITGNTATGNGGGIWNNSSITVTADANSNVDSNTATGDGGGIYNSGGTLTFNSKFFVGMNTAKNGGGIYHYAGTIQLNIDISMRTNTAKANGGGIYSKSDFNMTKGGYVGSWAVAGDNLGNKAVLGAGIYLEAKTFSVDGTLSMGHNIASSQGGGIYIQGGTFHQKSGTLRLGAHTYSTDTAVAGNEANAGGGVCMTGGTFKCEGTLLMNGNKAKTGNGGGILAENATSVSITGTGNEIKNNTAQAQGGAMRCYNTNTTVKNATIDNNTATNGHAGGLIVYRGDGADGTLTLENCDITNNKCLNSHGQGVNGNTTEDDDRGAGIYAQAINVSITGGSITGNTTPYGVGGGIYFNSSGKNMTIKNCTISNNKAQETNATNANKAGYGGGICIVAGKDISITGSTISGNKSDDCGGGMYIAASIGSVKIGTTTIGGTAAANGNQSGKSGGGIYTFTAVELTGGSVSYNKANNQGGGIFLDSCALTVKSGTTIQYNSTETSHGGGIYSAGGNVDLQANAKVQNNTAKTCGGGIYMWKENASAQPTLSLATGVEIKNNVATSGEAITVNSATDYAGGGGVVLNDAKMSMAGTASIHDNSTGGGGGGVCILTAASTITIASGATPSIYKNTATKNGGGIYAAAALTISGTLTVGSSTATNGNTATVNGGGIYAANTLSLTSVTVQNNKGVNGGGIYVNNTTTLSSTKVNNNSTTSGSGGGIYINAGATTVQSSSEVNSNYSATYGAGVYMVGGSLTVDASKVDSNKSYNNGSGICMNNSNVAMTTTLKNGASVSNNIAGIASDGTTAGKNGNCGGIWVCTKSTLNLQGSTTIAGNKANLAAGGGIYVTGGAVSITGTNNNVTGNSASTNGGGIWMGSGSVTIGSGASLTVGASGKANTAANGGGLFLGGGTFTNSGVLAVAYNTASTNGGGIYTKISLTLGSTSSVTNNKAGSTSAGGNGGGVYIESGTVTVNSTNATTISSNEAIAKNTSNGGGFGGGIYVNTGAILDLKAGTLSGNKATVSGTPSQTALGGGIYAKGNVNVTGNFTLSGNQTSRYGGGMYIAGSTVTISSGKTLTVNGTNTAGQYGGGIVVNSGSITGAGGMTVKSNTATSGGGGICMDSGGTINISGKLDISSNTTSGYGGGVCITGGSASFAPTGIMEIYSNSAGTNGGGVYVSNGSFAPAVTGSNYINIRNNTATSHGAGVYYSGGTFNPTGDVRIYSNTASGNGGGIYTTGTTWTLASTVKICDNDKKVGNTAANGGGIYVNSGSLTLGGTYVYYNTATTDGGGIYLNDGTISVTSGTTVNAQYNKANNGHGGGVYLKKGTVTLAGTLETSNNTAKWGAGLYVGLSTDNSGTVNMSGAGELHVRWNVASENGGGIQVERVTFNLSCATVWVGYNSTTNGYGGGINVYASDSVFNETGDTTFLIYANTAKTNGGGVYVQAGTFKTNGKMNIGRANTDSEQANQAVSGGGVYVASGKFETSGTVTIEYNDVNITNGGGIYMAGGTLTNSGTLHVRYNTASADGGGIYFNGGTLTNNSTLNVNNNKAVNSNTSVATSGGGIYMAGGTITNNGAMTVSSNVVGTSATTNNKGGGVYLASGTFKTVGNLSISTNQAYKGAGVFLTGGIFETAGTSTSNTYYIGNNKGVGTTAASHGAGFFAENGTIRVNSAANLCVYRNFANYGPGIFFGQNGGTITIDGSGAGVLWVHENHDTSADGSAIWIESCTVEMKHTTSVNRQVHGAADEAGKNGNTKGAIRIQKLSSRSDKGILNVYAKLLIQNCEGGDWSGGITMTADGVLNVKSDGKLEITGCSSTGNGGAIQNTGGTITNAGTMTIGGDTAALGNKAGVNGDGTTSSTAGNGGGIYVKGGSFSSTGTLVVKQNKAEGISGKSLGNGGGIHVEGNATFSITGSNNVISNNTTTRHGGGVCIYDGNGTIQNCTISNNDATNGHAGGVFIKDENDSGKTLTLTSCTITGNECLNGNGGTDDTDRGAGVYAEDVNLTISGGSVSSNKTYYGVGGGIFFSAAKWALSVSDCTVNSNTAKNVSGKSSGHGGGIYINKAKSASISGLTVNGNSADGNGGGIYIAGGTTLENSGDTYIIGNTSAGDGGGIYAKGNITNTGKMSLSANQATNCGGGIYTEGTVTTTEMHIGGPLNTDANRAAYGGGIYIKSGIFNSYGATVTLRKNVATSHGGGIYMYDGTLTWQANGSNHGNYMVYENTASKGGGVYVRNGNITCASDKQLNIHSNTASYGAGMYLGGKSDTDAGMKEIVFSGSGAGLDVYNNTASTNGGGIMAEVCNVTIGMKTYITNNKASNATSGKGAGLFLGAWSVGVTCTIGADVYIYANAAAGNGGGIFLADTSTGIPVELTINSGGTVKIQKASYSERANDPNSAKSGGGIYAGAYTKLTNNGTLTVDGNQANNGDGGGIYVASGTLTNGGTLTVSNNQATVNGGGIYANGTSTSKATLVNNATMTVETNQATSNGGGLFLATNTVFSPTGTLNVNGNAATVDGGGIYTEIALTLNAATIGKSGSGNTAGDQGGGIYCTKAVTIALGAASTVSYNEATAHGGGIYMENATVKLEGTSSIHHNEAGGNGGGIHYTSGAITLSGTPTIHTNSADHGGGIFATAALTLNGTLTIGGGSNQANKATAGNGGGIYANAGATLSGGIHVKYNTASNNGGGIYVKAGTLTTSGTVAYYVSNNTATSNGGGIYVDKEAIMTTATGKSIQIEKNTATNGNGGGLYNAGTVNFDVRGQVNGNTATNGNGGGIYNAGTVTAKDGISLRLNTAGSKGGGIYMAGGSFEATGTVYVGSWQSAEANNGEGNGNRAIDGAGIYQADGTLEVANLQMGHNIASGNGGGIYMAGGSMKFTGGTQNIGSFFYDKATVPGNQAVNGAGIYLAGGDLDVSGSAGVNIGDNVATNKGGGIYTMVDLTLGSAVKVGFERTDNGTALKLGNYAVDGAGIYVQGKTLTLGGVQVMYNAASNDGGGIYMQGGKLQTSGNSIGNVTANYAGVTRNTDGTVAATTTGGNGGGIYLTNKATMTMNGGTLSGNYAYAMSDTAKSGTGFGGGIYVDAGVEVTLQGGGKISGNEAKVDSARAQTALGGGIYTKGKITIAGNFEISGNKSDRYGGGIYQAGDANTAITISSGTLTVKENSAVNFGGGMVLNMGTVTVTGTLNVNGNSAGSGGGGIYFDGAATLSGGGSISIFANSAANGGGMRLDHADAKFIPTGKVDIYENKATNGGGIYVQNGTVSLQKASTIRNHTLRVDGSAMLNGGGIYMAGGKVTLDGASEVKNNAVVRPTGADNGGNGGGVHVAAGATLEVKGGSKITDNTASYGGGISAGGTVTVTNSFVSGNTATGTGGGIFVSGTVTVNGTSKIQGNKAYNGGGVRMTSGSITLQDTATIADNTATGSGGGVNMGGGTLTLAGTSSITGNQATGGTGGGICQADGRFIVSGTPVITGNTASSNGGGIYLSNSTDTNATIEIHSGATLTVGASGKANTATNGGGMYLNAGSFTNSGTLKVDYNTATADGGGIYTNVNMSIGGSNSTITGNAAGTNTATGGNGGGIYVAAGTLTLSGGTISNNTTTAKTGDASATGFGGGLCQKGGTVTISGSTALNFTGNHAYRGGAIAVLAGTLTANSSLNAHQNTAVNDAGGVQVQGTADVTLTGSTIESNTARWGGGAYVMGGKLTLDGGTVIQSNTATSCGGGVYTSAGTTSVKGASKIQNNTANGDGGGMCILGTANVTVTGSGTEIGGNHALNGGGVCLTVAGNGKSGTMELSGGASIKGNDATYGGGVYMDGGTLSLKSNSVIEGNTASQHGGGIRYGGGTISLPTTASELVEIRGNTASSCGGGIYAETKALSLNGHLLIGGSTSETNGNKARQGGGIYANTVDLTLNGVKVNYNKADEQGGGIKINSGNLTLDGGAEVSYNKTTTNGGGGTGGGIYAISATNANKTTYTVKVLNATMKGNRAFTNGGAIMAFDVNVTLGEGNKKATLTENYAEGNSSIGGAIHIQKHYVTYGNNPNYWLRPEIGAPTLSIVNASITKNSATSGGAIHTQDAFVVMTGGDISENTARSAFGGGIYFANHHTADTAKAAQLTTSLVMPTLTIEGGTITKNKAINAGGGIYLGSYGELVMTKAAKSPVFGNTADVEGNDLYAVGDTTTVNIRDTMDGTAKEYWFADYALGNAKYPGKPTFPSDYTDAKGAFDHLGRYASNKTPITFARRSFGAAYDSKEDGALEASTATLALTLGLEQKLFMNLTLEKKLKLGETAVEDTTFIFYVKGLDNADFLMPVMIHLKKGEIAGSVTIRDLPMGIYDVCEDESWSWRYAPTNVAYSDNGNGMAYVVDNGDDYVRIKGFTTAGQTCKVTFTNGLDISRCRWLTDAYYFLPTKLTRSVTPREDDEDETE